MSTTTTLTRKPLLYHPPTSLLSFTTLSITLSLFGFGLYNTGLIPFTIPDVSEARARAGAWVLVVTTLIHIVESAVLHRKLRRQGLGTNDAVWWKWMVTGWFEALPTQGRLEDAVRERDGEEKVDRAREGRALT